MKKVAAKTNPELELKVVELEQKVKFYQQQQEAHIRDEKYLREYYEKVHKLKDEAEITITQVEDSSGAVTFKAKSSIPMSWVGSGIGPSMTYKFPQEIGLHQIFGIDTPDPWIEGLGSTPSAAVADLQQKIGLFYLAWVRMVKKS